MEETVILSCFRLGSCVWLLLTSPYTSRSASTYPITLMNLFYIYKNNASVAMPHSSSDDENITVDICK